jgi:hypothetical protein
MGKETMSNVFINDFEDVIQSRIPACSLKAGKQLEQGILIQDMAGMKIGGKVIKFD